MRLFLIIFSILSSLFFASSLLFADENETKKHPIDIELEKCLSINSNMTTAGMTRCADAAYDRWDKELNRVYKELTSKLDEEGKNNLKQSQLAWIKYRDLEFKNIDMIYKNLQGTMYIPMRVNNRIGIVKNRVIELSGYLSLMNM